MKKIPQNIKRVKVNEALVYFSRYDIRYLIDWIAQNWLPKYWSYVQPIEYYKATAAATEQPFRLAFNYVSDALDK